jgi:hypothetical protein
MAIRIARASWFADQRKGQGHKHALEKRTLRALKQIVLESTCTRTHTNPCKHRESVNLSCNHFTLPVVRTPATQLSAMQQSRQCHTTQLSAFTTAQHSAMIDNATHPTQCSAVVSTCGSTALATAALSLQWTVRALGMRSAALSAVHVQHAPNSAALPMPCPWRNKPTKPMQTTTLAYVTNTSVHTIPILS